MKKIVIFSISLTLNILGFVLYAEAKTPNDTFYFKQWHLELINAPVAWEKTTGSSEVIVAVVDTRIDINHEDLKENIWTNAGEIPMDGLDNDGNGYRDDVHGWNFVSETHDLLPKPGGSESAFVHGTLTSSLIGARGNNGIGVSGVAWQVRIMPLVALDLEGSGLTSDVAEAVYYAADNGADIINLSIEGYIDDTELDEAIAYARSKGALTVAAAGNSVLVDGLDLDVTPVYPACLAPLGYYGIVAVGGTDEADQKAPYANYGSCIDVSAPGFDIYGARPVVFDENGIIIEPGYAGEWSGTSLSTAIVSGVAALLKAAHPAWGAAELRDRLRQSVVTIDQINDAQFAHQLGTGRIDAGKALEDVTTEVISGERLELLATTPGLETTIQLWSEHEVIQVLPFGPKDIRGAHAAFSDLDGDGTPEIAVVNASGRMITWVVYGRDGNERKRGTLPVLFTDGALVASVHGGFVIADQNGGNAYGLDDVFSLHQFYPYGPNYNLGMDLLAVSDAVAFAPRQGGGRLLITDVTGKSLVNAFPFGMEESGRWSVARVGLGGYESLVFSGPAGSKQLNTKLLGNEGWQDIAFSELESASTIITSAGTMSTETLLRRYDTWPH